MTFDLSCTEEVVVRVGTDMCIFRLKAPDIWNSTVNGWPGLDWSTSNLTSYLQTMYSNGANITLYPGSPMTPEQTANIRDFVAQHRSYQASDIQGLCDIIDDLIQDNNRLEWWVIRLRQSLTTMLNHNGNGIDSDCEFCNDAKKTLEATARATIPQITTEDESTRILSSFPEGPIPEKGGEMHSLIGVQLIVDGGVDSNGIQA